MLSEYQKNTIQDRVMNYAAIPCQLAGQRLLLDAAGVVFWPKHQLLIFSDLHFEKASFLSQFANPLPKLDTQDTVKRMLSALSVYTPQHVVCLGDSLHDGNALNRMLTSDLAAINIMLDGVAKWTWVLGNHDPSIPADIAGDRAQYLVLDNILLVHEPEDLNTFIDADAQIIGHFHPKTRKKLARHWVKGKCFSKDESKLLMPAFGSYTGGLDIQHEVLTSLMTASPECYLMYNQKIYLV